MSIYKIHFLDFTWDNKNLIRCLKHKKAFFDKDGLGYDGTIKETHFKDFFAKSNDSHEGSSKCAYYKKLVHSIQSCPLKMSLLEANLSRVCGFLQGLALFKMKWIPKGTRFLSTNTQGPKKI